MNTNEPLSANDVLTQHREVTTNLIGDLVQQLVLQRAVSARQEEQIIILRRTVEELTLKQQ